MNSVDTICRRCQKPYLAEYGHSAVHCSEECAAPPVVALPEDDDAHAGLSEGDHHCVFPQAGCDPDELPPEWRAEAARVVAEYRPHLGTHQGCACGHSHRLLPREDVRRLRLAGYVVELEGRDARYDDWDPRDRREMLDEMADYREYIRGVAVDFDDTGDDRREK